jgi:hypothetical protein
MPTLDQAAGRDKVRQTWLNWAGAFCTLGYRDPLRDCRCCGTDKDDAKQVLRDICKHKLPLDEALRERQHQVAENGGDRPRVKLELRETIRLPEWR